MVGKKTFFREATKAEIKRKDLVETAGLTDVSEIGQNQYVIMDSVVPRGYDSARKFMKHGPEVKLRRAYSLDQAVNMGKTPVQLREDSFDSLKQDAYCGYSFLPLGKDGRKRKVSLIECLEGARIFAYANQVRGTDIKVKAYADAKRVRRDGAEVVAEVPSRIQGEKRMKLKLTSVPIVDSREKYGIALGIGSDHSCASKRFNIRYTYSDDKESSGIVNVCAHEIAGYLQLIQQEWNENKNMIPLQMCQFAIPSQETVDFYLRLENSVLVKDLKLKSKDKLRRMSRAEKEIALWNFVKEKGHDKTFFSQASRDGDVAEYDWNFS